MCSLYDYNALDYYLCSVVQAKVKTKRLKIVGKYFFCQKKVKGLLCVVPGYYSLKKLQCAHRINFYSLNFNLNETRANALWLCVQDIFLYSHTHKHTTIESHFNGVIKYRYRSPPRTNKVRLYTGIFLMFLCFCMLYTVIICLLLIH